VLYARENAPVRFEAFFWDMTAFISVIIQGTFRFRHIPWWEPLVQGWRQATNPASWLMIVCRVEEVRRVHREPQFPIHELRWRR
jgi:hypothetical protein